MLGKLRVYMASSFFSNRKARSRDFSCIIFLFLFFFIIFSIFSIFFREQVFFLLLRNLAQSSFLLWSILEFCLLLQSTYYHHSRHNGLCLRAVVVRVARPEFIRLALGGRPENLEILQVSFHIWFEFCNVLKILCRLLEFAGKYIGAIVGGICIALASVCWICRYRLYVPFSNLPSSRGYLLTRWFD